MHYSGVFIMSFINSWSVALSESVPSCSCPPETLPCAFKCDLDEVDRGIFFVSIPVDSDLPFCPFCELAQLDVSAPYACQCEDF